jgi:hypothetical protein
MPLRRLYQPRRCVRANAALFNNSMKAHKLRIEGFDKAFGSINPHVPTRITTGFNGIVEKINFFL